MYANPRTKTEQPIACAALLFCGTDFGIFERSPAMTSRRVKGANRGPRQNCGRIEERKRAARPSDCGARGIGLAEGCQKDTRRRSATGRVQKKEARRHHSGRQKAPVIGDEETLGRAPQKIVLTGNEENSREGSPALTGNVLYVVLSPSSHTPCLSPPSA